MELNFLTDLAGSRRLRQLPFAIIGSYRDNEVDEHHPLTASLESMKMQSVRLYTIDILPFTRQETRDLLSEILGVRNNSDSKVSQLSDILFEKSQGNLIFYLEVCCPDADVTISAPSISLRTKSHSIQRSTENL
jgi:predicted ATPase